MSSINPSTRRGEVGQIICAHAINTGIKVGLVLRTRTRCIIAFMDWALIRYQDRAGLELRTMSCINATNSRVSNLDAL